MHVVYIVRKGSILTGRLNVCWIIWDVVQGQLLLGSGPIPRRAREWSQENSRLWPPNFGGHGRSCPQLCSSFNAMPASDPCSSHTHQQHLRSCRRRRHHRRPLLLSICAVSPSFRFQTDPDSVVKCYCPREETPNQQALIAALHA